MQTGKKAVEKAKETAANTAGSARAGMEKTKATLQEKGEKLTSHDPAHNEMATEKKEDRKADAELSKQAAYDQNVAEKDARTTPFSTHSTTGSGYTASGGTHQMSALPGHGTGEPAGGHLAEGTAAGSHPIGRGTGTTRSSTAHNTRVGGGTDTGYTGSGYSG